MPTGVYPHKPHQLFQKGHKIWLGRKLSEAHKLKLRKPKAHPSHFKGKNYTEIYGVNASQQLEVRRYSRLKFHDAHGRKTLFRRPRRHLWRHREFRRAVFERDDYTCQLCGERGGELAADHFPMTFASIVQQFGIRTMAEALRCDALWNPDNGRTLCSECHKQTPSYGAHNMTCELRRLMRWLRQKLHENKTDATPDESPKAKLLFSL